MGEHRSHRGKSWRPGKTITHHHSSDKAEVAQEAASKEEITNIGTPLVVALRRKGPQENTESELQFLC